MARSSTASPSRRKPRSATTPSGGRSATPATVSVELPVRRPQMEFRSWGVCNRPRAAYGEDAPTACMEEAVSRMRERCAASPVPAGWSPEGMVAAVSSTLRPSYLASDWPSLSALTLAPVDPASDLTPPRPGAHLLSPEGLVDAQRVLDRLPAYPWTERPDGVYDARGRFLADTGWGDGGLARDIAALPGALDAAIREAEDSTRHLRTALKDIIEAEEEKRATALKEARDKAAKTGWEGGWVGGFEQGVGRAHNAITDEVETQRVALRNRLDALDELVAGEGSDAIIAAVRALRGEIDTALREIEARAESVDKSTPEIADCEIEIEDDAAPATKSASRKR